MNNRFTKNAERALKKTEEIAGTLGHTHIGSEHILLGLLGTEESIASGILEGKGLCYGRVYDALVEYAGIGAKTQPSGKDMTPRAIQILEHASSKTALDGATAIGTEHILLSLLEEGESVGCRLLRSLGVGVSELRTEIAAFLSSCSEMQNEQKKDFLSSLPHLKNYGQDLTAFARDGKYDPVIGREQETERLIEVLSRRRKNDPCLIGEPGVGKTAIVEGLAERISKRNVPATLLDKRIISLDLSGMIAGAKYRGEFEERLKGILEELRKNKNILLFIDEIHILCGAGAAEGAIDAANILKPALSRGEVQIIGATTLGEYRKYIEKDAALERRFQPILVNEPSVAETIRILHGILPRYEAHHGVRIGEDAVKAAAELSKRYIHDRFLPDKAIDLIDEASARLRIRSEHQAGSLLAIEDELIKTRAKRDTMLREKNFDAVIEAREKENDLLYTYKHRKKENDSTEKLPPLLTEGDIASLLTATTGIPIYRLTAKNSEHLANMESELKARIVGQDTAINAVSYAVLRSMAGLRDQNRPIGSFLFLGPSGVGKTACARAMAEIVFGTENALIRLDMSEYKEAYSISKIIGAAPGYIGYDEGGKLTERVRKAPHSLILFDEIEKACPDIYGLLLQILEDGCLTDSHGRRVDFRSTIIVITSNLIATLPPHTGFSFCANDDASDVRKETEQALSQHFRPEFLNRIDELVVFSSLNESNLSSIAEAMLKSLAEKSKINGLTVSFDESVAPHLAKIAAKEKNGARPLRRLIVKEIENPLSLFLLQKNEKQKILHISAESGDLRIEGSSP